MTLNIEHYRALLTAERANLEDELATVAQRTADNPADWEARPVDMDIMEADLNEAADRIEERQDTQGVLDELERRYQNVIRAQKKIVENEYGVCELGGEPIEEDRLQVNPSARTCKKHMEEESTLPM